MSSTPSPAVSSALALHGGPRAKPAPYGTGRRFGPEELQQLSEALDQNTLFYTKGRKTAELRKQFAARYGVGHCVPCSSGTAALHIALAACGVKPGDEVITSPMTDMGTCSAILFCGAIPIFADVDARSYTLDPASVEAHVGPRTAAIIAVHLTGAPCDLDALQAIARRHDLWLIEDCAQAFQCEYRGRLCGSIGDLGCFSLNDFKHISAGDAGLVLTDDPALARQAELFADKCYDRTPGVSRNPAFLAPNYRMCELHAAVALAQLAKLDAIVARRRRYGEGLGAGLQGIPASCPRGSWPGRGRATGSTCCGSTSRSSAPARSSSGRFRPRASTWTRAATRGRRSTCTTSSPGGAASAARSSRSRWPPMSGTSRGSARRRRR